MCAADASYTRWKSRAGRGCICANMADSLAGTAWTYTLTKLVDHASTQSTGKLPASVALAPCFIAWLPSCG